MPSFHGAWPALITPTTPAGGVDLSRLRELIAYLLSKQMDGFYLCGATGEGLLLSVAERKLVVEQALDQIAGRVPAIVHVGCAATRDAVELAEHAQHAGAAGISSVLPVVGAGLPSTYLHYTAIAAAAPDLPFFPYLYGGQIDALSLMRGLMERIPNVAGCKYTGPNMFELAHLCQMADDRADLGRHGWTLFSGMDEQCVLAALYGAPANIGSTLNLMPGIYRTIRACCDRGDLAQALDLQRETNHITTLLIEYGLHGALREAMRMIGLECGEPRLPNPSLVPEQRTRLRRDLEKAGLMAIAAM